MIVLWRVTERCNLACGFCAYDRRLRFVRHEVDPTEVERLSRLLAEYSRSTGDRVLVSWLGGEPFLWKPMFEASRRLHASGLAVSATTNGTLLSRPQVRRDVVACFSELTVSVDGPAAFHDASRDWRGGWSRLRSSVRALSGERDAAALKLRANVVLMHDNVGMFEDLCGELSDWGIDEITFNQLGGRDRPEFYAAHRLWPEDAQALVSIVPALRDRLARRGVKLCGSADYLRRITASAADRRIAVDDCGPGERFLFIDERGRISPCSFTSAALGMPVRAVRSVDDLVRLRSSFANARGRSRPEVCGDCPSTHVHAKFAA